MIALFCAALFALTLAVALHVATLPSPTFSRGEKVAAKRPDEGVLRWSFAAAAPPHPSPSATPSPPGRGLASALDWIIAGGESGRDARPAHPDWFRAVRNQCAAAGTPFFFKQWGEHEPTELIVDDRPEPWRRAPSGREFWSFKEFGIPKDQLPAVTFARIGKSRTGRLLDGILHDAFPAVGENPSPLRGGWREGAAAPGAPGGVA